MTAAPCSAQRRTGSATSSNAQRRTLNSTSMAGWSFEWINGSMNGSHVSDPSTWLMISARRARLAMHALERYARRAMMPRARAWILHAELWTTSSLDCSVPSVSSPLLARSFRTGGTIHDAGNVNTPHMPQQPCPLCQATAPSHTHIPARRLPSEK